MKGREDDFQEEFWLVQYMKLYSAHVRFML